MCDSIAHRGPDDHRYFFSGPGGDEYYRHELPAQGEGGVFLGLGHRRLAIVDIAGGHQPMPNEDRRLWLVYNGEIFNHQDLRPDLIRRGHNFATQSDTEVILHLYEEQGPDCAKTLNGQFAFGLWDSHQQHLVLVRDRFGIKPLYYTQYGGYFAFASEIKALLTLPGLPRRLNYQALAEHFTFQNTFGEKTFFEGIHLLPPGHHLTISKDGALQLREYWDLSYTAQAGDPRKEEALREALRGHLERAVQRQLMSEVPVGAHLSGGMDSGSIAALASLHLPHLKTFTCGFDLPPGADEYEQHFDESALARLTAAHLDLEHHELRLGPGHNFPTMPALIRHLDEPRVGISYQNYWLAQFVRQSGVTVVLGGAGGDELFAGYLWRYQAIADLNDRARFAERYYGLWTRFLSDEAKRDWFFSPQTTQALGDFSTYRDSFLPILARAGGDDPLHWALYFDAKTFLHGLLVVEDKVGMAASTEERFPLLDHDLVDFSLNLPARWKLQGGEGKYLLRQVMRRYVPAEIAGARKQGFTPPDATWYRTVLRPQVEGLLLSERALGRGVFQAEGIKRILEEHFSARQNHRFLIWSLMLFEEWWRAFMD
jgi:asparagine synthase (glutamine-hydrolysing)